MPDRFIIPQYKFITQTGDYRSGKCQLLFSPCSFFLGNQGQHNTICLARKAHDYRCAPRKARDAKVGKSLSLYISLIAPVGYVSPALSKLTVLHRTSSRLSPDNPGAKQTSRMFYCHCHCVPRDVGPYYTSRLNQLQSLEAQKRKTSGKALLCSVQP